MALRDFSGEKGERGIILFRVPQIMQLSWILLPAEKSGTLIPMKSLIIFSIRTFVLLIFCAISYDVRAQDLPGDKSNPEVLLTGKQLNHFVDSLRKKVLADTAKFDERDVIYSNSGRHNARSYSKLYIVNGAYLYKMDVIPSREVVAFAKEILNPRKIKSLVVMDSKTASSAFGPETWNGVIVITLYARAKFNPMVGGLQLHSKNAGDNFFIQKIDDKSSHGG